MGANQWHGTDYSIPYLDSGFRSDPVGHSSNDASSGAIVSPSFFLAFVLFIMYFLLLLVLLLWFRLVSIRLSLVLGAERRAFIPARRMWHKH